MASLLANGLDCISIVWSANEQNSIVKKNICASDWTGKRAIIASNEVMSPQLNPDGAFKPAQYSTTPPGASKNLPDGCMLSGLCCMLNNVPENGGVTECFIAFIFCPNYNCSCFPVPD